MPLCSSFWLPHLHKETPDRYAISTNANARALPPGYLPPVLPEG